MTTLEARSGRTRAIHAMSLAALVGVAGATTVLAGDNSYRRIVNQLRSEYRATEQSLYGGGMLAGLAVAFTRPAGVSNVKFTILKNLDHGRGRAREFNDVIRSAIESRWRRLVVLSAPMRQEWTHVYSQPDGRHIKLLIVNRDRSEVFVAEVRIDPDKLSAFIDNPQILGIPVGDR